MRIVLPASILALFCLLSSARAEAPVNARSRHEVLLSIDGLSASYLKDPQAEQPTIRKWMAEGAMPVVPLSNVDGKPLELLTPPAAK